MGRAGERDAISEVWSQASSDLPVWRYLEPHVRASQRHRKVRRVRERSRGLRYCIYGAVCGELCPSGQDVAAGHERGLTTQGQCELRLGSPVQALRPADLTVPNPQLQEEASRVSKRPSVARCGSRLTDYRIGRCETPLGRRLSSLPARRGNVRRTSQAYQAEARVWKWGCERRLWVPI